MFFDPKKLMHLFLLFFVYLLNQRCSEVTAFSFNIGNLGVQGHASERESKRSKNVTAVQEQQPLPLCKVNGKSIGDFPCTSCPVSVLPYFYLLVLPLGLLPIPLVLPLGLLCIPLVLALHLLSIPLALPLRSAHHLHRLIVFSYIVVHYQGHTRLPKCNNP